MAEITSTEFKLLADYIYKVSGIYLEPNKKYLLETRLGPLLSSCQCATFHELYKLATQNNDQELKKAIINAISTNETLFFRDHKPFELLKHKIIPDLIDRRQRKRQGKTKIRIWSAACSTGQEVYSIIISLFDVLGNLDDYEFYILGTDISDEAISKASYGCYSKFEIERGLPEKVRQRYFQPVANGWRIKDKLRSLAVFKKINLLESYNPLGTFDIIFCRNVAIYFTNQDKRRLFQKLSHTLAADGYLIIGGAESLAGIAPQFVARHYLQGIFYQLQGGGKVGEEKENLTPINHTSIPCGKTAIKKPAQLFSQPKSCVRKKNTTPDLIIDGHTAEQSISITNEPLSFPVVPTTTFPAPVGGTAKNEGSSNFIRQLRAEPEPSSSLLAALHRKGQNNSSLGSKKDKNHDEKSFLRQLTKHTRKAETVNVDPSTHQKPEKN